MDRTLEGGVSEGSVAPEEPACLHGAVWMATDQPGERLLGHAPARTFLHHKKSAYYHLNP